jgi:tape measure domain-containing protein
MDGGTVTFHFKGDGSNLDSKLNDISSSLKGLTSKITVGNLASKGLSKAFSVMNSHMDDAISRIDTMNNFPNVMSNLGIDAKESEKSIKKMSKALEGLPTTLDSGAMAVQRFTSANSDVGKSTDMFLALNNALLAGGASTEIQASALEQLSQAYAKGKPDMMEWRTLQTAMPAQLKQVASAFNMTSAELGEALRKGDISMDDFMNKIIDLNKNGTGNFKSFEEQAKNSTNGLRTNLTNLGTAITKGMANTFNSINESLQKANLPTIQEMIKSLTKNITKGFNQVSKVIAKIPWQKVITAIKIITPLAIALFTGFMAYKMVVGVLNAVAVAQALLNTVMMANPIGIIIGLISGFIALLVVLYKKCEWFRNIVNTVFTFVKVTIQATFLVAKEIVTFLAKHFKDKINAMILVIKLIITAIKTFVNKVKSDFNTIKNFIKNAITNIANTIKSLPGKIASIPGKIIQLFKEIPGKLLNVGKNIVKGLWQGAKDMKDWVVNKFKGLGKGILNGMKKALGIKSPSKEFAIIGRFSMLGYTKGLEEMQPEIQKTIDSMFNLSPSMAGTMNNTLSPNINVMNNVNVETDPIGQVVSKIKTFSGGAKNDYNYGYGG